MKHEKFAKAQRALIWHVTEVVQKDPWVDPGRVKAAQVRASVESTGSKHKRVPGRKRVGQRLSLGGLWGWRQLFAPLMPGDGMTLCCFLCKSLDFLKNMNLVIKIFNTPDQGQGSRHFTAPVRQEGKPYSQVLHRVIGAIRATRCHQLSEAT